MIDIRKRKKNVDCPRAEGLQSQNSHTSYIRTFIRFLTSARLHILPIDFAITRRSSKTNVKYSITHSTVRPPAGRIDIANDFSDFVRGLKCLSAIFHFSGSPTLNFHNNFINLILIFIIKIKKKKLLINHKKMF